MLDTPLHVHSKENELFYVMEGEHTRGDEEFRIDPGDAIFPPRAEVLGIPLPSRLR